MRSAASSIARPLRQQVPRTQWYPCLALSDQAARRTACCAVVEHLQRPLGLLANARSNIRIISRREISLGRY